MIFNSNSWINILAEDRGKNEVRDKGAGTFHSASQSKEE